MQKKGENAQKKESLARRKNKAIQKTRKEEQGTEPLFCKSRFGAILQIVNCIVIQPQFGRFKRESDANKKREGLFSTMAGCPKTAR